MRTFVLIVAGGAMLCPRYIPEKLWNNKRAGFEGRSRKFSGRLQHMLTDDSRRIILARVLVRDRVVVDAGDAGFIQR